MEGERTACRSLFVLSVFDGLSACIAFVERPLTHEGAFRAAGQEGQSPLALLMGAQSRARASISSRGRPTLVRPRHRRLGRVSKVLGTSPLANRAPPPSALSNGSRSPQSALAARSSLFKLRAKATTNSSRDRDSLAGPGGTEEAARTTTHQNTACCHWPRPPAGGGTPEAGSGAPVRRRHSVFVVGRALSRLLLRFPATHDASWRPDLFYLFSDATCGH